MNASDPRHGTYAGYQRHNRDGESACMDCREANRAYARQHREKPRSRRRDNEASKAGSRAAWRTVAAHRADYERFYAEELTTLRATGGVA